MMASTDNHDLLSVLRALFQRVFRMNMAQRLNLHKRKPASDSVDLSESLYQQIDKLSTTNRNDSAIIDSRVSAATDDVKNTSVSSSRTKNLVYTTSSTPVTDLSNHLKTEHGNHYSQSELGKRLERSAWDHLHKSIYYARDGKTEDAKLHAKISLQAIKEAHQFLSDDEYTRLTRDIQKIING